MRDTDRVRAMVAGLFDRGILAVGLTFPVVPKGDETIRFQINAAHTEADIAEVLEPSRKPETFLTSCRDTLPRQVAMDDQVEARLQEHVVEVRRLLDKHRMLETVARRQETPKSALLEQMQHRQNLVELHRRLRGLHPADSRTSSSRFRSRTVWWSGASSSRHRPGRRSSRSAARCASR